MKTITSVFLIFSCIGKAIFIFPTILGLIAYRTLQKAQKRNEVIRWGIVVLIFVSVIAGVLMLCMRDEDLVEEDHATASVDNQKADEERQHKYFDMDVAERLMQLKQLFDDGIISQEVYDAKKAKYLSQINI